VYHHGNATDNLCYQTNYTDANYQSKGYVPGFCPFQLIDSVEIDTICNNHSEENLKYCPDSQINITIYKMGKSLDKKEQPGTEAGGVCNTRECG